MTPRATYRLQLHKDFTFADAGRAAPYLRQLGVSHVYASPIQTARAGSTHGYDVVDHARINPELGGEAGFEEMAAALKAQKLGLILDIVPNHMAVGAADNRAWLDVLHKGRDSAFARWFDIDFDTEDAALKGKILAPFLGAPYGDVLASGDLTLVRDDDLGLLAAAYHHHRFPLRPEDQDLDIGVIHDADMLHAVLERQHFRLAWWRTAGDRINWRRFFDITELAGLRIEDDAVFDAVHALPLDLYRRGLIDGLRIDHVDGLADPAAYCRKLRARLTALQGDRPPAYLVVEKILGAGEAVDPSWQVDGTTGYDFMNEVSALQHAADGEAALTALWHEISGRPADFEDEEKAARDEILTTGFEGALQDVARRLAALAADATASRDITAASLRRAVIQIIRHLRIYRTYATGNPHSPDTGAMFAKAVAAAKAERHADILAIDFVVDVLGRNDTSDIVRRFNQLTAPVTAKAVEDTAFYRYGRLLSRTDVGFEPGRFAMSAAAFGDLMAARVQHQPHSMLATATHDHKRGEDVRARLAVLSEMPDAWRESVRSWFALNDGVRPPGLERGDEYQLYQTLAGAWPLTLQPHDRPGLDTFRERVLGWRIKSLREAKLRSSWTMPDESYEAQTTAFLSALLDPARSSLFLDRLAAFVDVVARGGAMNGLVQAALKLTCPGVPDIYQGTEYWDLSLVDPDNRRPVDYDARARSIGADAADALVASWRDGRIKQALIRTLLHLRRDVPDVFTDGDYVPLPVDGARADHVLAFMRRAGSRQIAVVAVLRAASGLASGPLLTPAAGWWADTSVQLAPGKWRDCLSGATRSGTAVPVAGLLQTVPVAVLSRME